MQLRPGQTWRDMSHVCEICGKPVYDWGANQPHKLCRMDMEQLLWRFSYPAWKDIDFGMLERIMLTTTNHMVISAIAESLERWMDTHGPVAQRAIK